MAKGLGRGLDALLGNDLDIEMPSGNEKITFIPLNKIKANEDQARKTFTPEEISELSDSIKEFGVLQPVLLNTPEDGKYIIIAGERRWRAAKLAGLEEIPAIVKKLSQKELQEVSLIENLQRVNLNPIEKATGIKRLMDECNLTQEQVATRLSKNRASIANVLRLLNLPNSIKQLILKEKLSAGHGKCLVAVADKELQIYLANLAVEKELSVRELEKLILASQNKVIKREKVQDIEIMDFQNSLIERLGTKVKVQGSQKKGSIKIDYYSLDDLNRIYELLLK